MDVQQKIRPNNRSAKKIQKQSIKALIHRELHKESEKKFWAVVRTPTSVDFSGAVYDLSLVPQGDTDSSRDGDQIEIESIDFAFNLATGDAQQLMRLLLFCWKPNNVPSVTSILLGTGSTEAPLQRYNTDQRQQYTVLHDELFNLNTVSTPTIARQVRLNARRYAQFIAGSTAGTNHIYVLIVSDSGAVTHPTIAYCSKLQYFDH